MRWMALLSVISGGIEPPSKVPETFIIPLDDEVAEQLSQLDYWQKNAIYKPFIPVG